MRSGSETENKIRISNVKPRKVKRDIKERQQKSEVNASF